MRSAAMALLACGTLLAGCGAGPEETQPREEQPSRSGPARSIDVADPCTLVPEPQRQELGAQAAEIEANYGGMGCTLRSSEWSTDRAEEGWAVSVVLVPKTAGAYASEQMMEPAAHASVSGYPTTEQRTDPGCHLVADISDQGSLVVNAYLRPQAEAEPCQLAQRFAEAAIGHLPAA